MNEFPIMLKKEIDRAKRLMKEYSNEKQNG